LETDNGDDDEDDDDIGKEEVNVVDHDGRFVGWKVKDVTWEYSRLE